MSRLLLFSFLFWFPFWGTYQLQVAPRLDSPHAGEALQGMVEITGSTDLEDFESAELSFAYDVEQPDTWFWIADVTDPVSSGSLAGWDTNDLTDGNYRMRLVVTRADGSTVETQVRGLRVRNTTPIETDTPAPVTTVVSDNPPAALGTPAVTSLPAVQKTARPDQSDGSGVFGALHWLGYVVLAFVAVGLAALLRSLFQRR